MCSASAVICVDPSVECFTFEAFTDGRVWYAQDPSEVSWEWVGPNGDVLVSGDATTSTTIGEGCESLSLCEQCAEAGGFYCGDDESNWTVYSPNGCVPANYIADGWEDCVDASDEVAGATTDCGDDNGGDPTCEFGLTTITYDAAGMWNLKIHGQFLMLMEAYSINWKRFYFSI